MHTRVIVITLGLVMTLATSARAQERGGFWFDFAPIGIGSINVAVDEFDDRVTTGVGSLDLGWAINRRVLAGIELRFGGLTLEGSVPGDVDVYNIMAIVV